MASSEAPWTVMVPGDPGQLTGGYGYVREIVQGLEQLGQPVRLKGLAGRFPDVDQQARQSLEDALSALPAHATAIVDGLALGGCPEAAERHGHRLNLVALVHHPLADETGLSGETQRHFFETERRALAAVRRVITTSQTTAAGLSRYQVPAGRIATVPPGVQRPAQRPERVPTTPTDLRILCLAHLSPRKAQHQLVAALAQLPGPGWHCELAGSMSRDPDYAAEVRQQIEALGLADQIQLTGELSGPALVQSFRRANLFVLPSLYEGYGMVIDEALAHGLPVISSDGGALAVTADRPGCLIYPAGDVATLTGLLEERVRHPAMLTHQRKAALDSAGRLRSWREAAEEFRLAVVQALPTGSDFDASWLALREPADHAARSDALTLQALGWLRARGQAAPVIADIGSGTGSNWRYLNRALAAAGQDDCQWHLFDQDARLLAGVPRTESGPIIHVERLQATTLGQCLPRPLNLLTASALIDLVSRNWLDALAGAAADRQAAVLIVLSYAGHFRLLPEHRADDALRHWVNQHQHGDKGTGAACGPDASEYLARALKGMGYRVTSEPSVWHLDNAQSALQRALMEGWVEAARAQLLSETKDSPPDSRWLDQWLAERARQADQGQLVIEVDHIDLLGVPES
ncbi:glycosyltransferase family 4 protein [Marinobacter lacisalsi]|uniref:Glycosyltransferase family 4 protein n=1 Tax=Marinobacter lacisalsi TaxID=475979 RepID=A0ABV8QLZ1_9GAMM